MILKHKGSGCSACAGVIGLVLFFCASLAGASGTGDPSSLPMQGTFGLGAEVDYGRRDLDDDREIDAARILARLNYSVLDQLGVYLKVGLFQTDTYTGRQSDWGIGIGAGVRGYLAEFQEGNIRIGYDVQVFRSQVEGDSKSMSQSLSRDEEVTWMEYQVSGIISWRAYAPLHLYTGVQFNKLDIESDMNIYHWDTQVTESFSNDSKEDKSIALLWGVTYQLADKVQLYGELRALAELNAVLGFHFAF